MRTKIHSKSFKKKSHKIPRSNLRFLILLLRQNWQVHGEYSTLAGLDAGFDNGQTKARTTGISITGELGRKKGSKS